MVIGRAMAAVRDVSSLPPMPANSELDVLDSSPYRSWVSVPDFLSDEQLLLWGVRPSNRSGAIEGAEVAVSNCSATRLGSTATFFSHNKTPVSPGDRVFLVQIWWIGVHLDREHGDMVREGDDLTLLSVERSFNLLSTAACAKSPMAMKENLRNSFESGKAITRQGVVPELPSPFILLNEGGFSIVKDAHGLVTCALQTASRSISRLTVAAILSARCLDDQMNAHNNESRLLCEDVRVDDVTELTKQTAFEAGRFGTISSIGEGNWKDRLLPSGASVSTVVSYSLLNSNFLRGWTSGPCLVFVLL